MSKAMKRRSLWWAMGLIVAVSVFADVWQADRVRGPRPFLPTGVVAAPGAKSMVVIVGSDDAGLSDPVPITVRSEFADDPHADMEARMNAAQIEEMVYKALNMDTSERSIREVVQPGDWVVIKTNMVTCPDGANIRNAYGQSSWSRGTNRGQDHWGQNTDLRVVRAVLKYLVEVDGDASRITIAEGGAEWNKLGEVGTNPDQEHDGWTAPWEPFDNLSYADIVAELQENAKGIPVDIVDLNYDDYVDKDGKAYAYTEDSPTGDPIPVPDPNGTGVTWFQREEGFYVSRTLLDCDKLINVPVMKTHDIPGVTTIHKQYVGTYMQRAYGVKSSSKGGLHGDGSDKVPNGFMDLFSYCPTDYSVVEGFWGVEGNGPQTGDDVKLNVIVAGGDPVATEAVVATIMGFTPSDIYHLHLSAAKGFGTWDPYQIEVVGRSIEEVRRPFRKPDNWILGPMGITRWLVNGPYEGYSIDEDYLGGEGAVTPKAGEVTNGVMWQETACDLRDHSELSLGEDSNRTRYGFTWVRSDAQRTVDMVAYGDDKIKVWLNGEVVESKYYFKQSVTLNEGYNALFVKVTNGSGASSMKVFLLDEDNNTPLGVEYRLRVEPTTAVEEEQAARPGAFRLSQNVPNPFNPSTWIPFELARSGHVRLTIYNLAGQKVRTLLDKELAAGIGYTTFWDGKDEGGRDAASGVYVAEMTGGEGAFRQTMKMTLVR